ncbi:MAG TPA: hypothetical protein VJP88_03055, partial [Caulobacteraceae bacterium]|nr:hypothetical protein [Caulobacteraceae bacterium]
RLLHQEIRSPGFGSPTVVESIGEILRIRLCRLARGRAEAGEATPLGQRELGLIRDCLETQRGRSPAVSELAIRFA